VKKFYSEFRHVHRNLSEVLQIAGAMLDMDERKVLCFCTLRSCGLPEVLPGERDINDEISSQPTAFQPGSILDITKSALAAISKRRW
jgi:hypothetical protein